MGWGLIRLRYVHSFRDRHGKLRFYFRRNATRTALPGLPGSAEFMAVYQRCIDKVVQEPAEARGIVSPRSFRALATKYYASPKYLSLSTSSKKNYRRVIDGFLVEHGHRRVDQMRREHIDSILGKMSDRPGAGIILLKRIRTLINYAIALGWRDTDPTAGAMAYRSKEFHTWTEPEIDKFEKRWPVGTRQRLAFSLLLFTGQRGSDIHRMVWPDIAGDTIHVAQQKTGQESSDEKLEIPLHPDLQEVLSLEKKRHVAILVTAYGKQFSVKGFGQFMSDAIRDAELPAKCKAHGLRKAAARRLAEAGCSAHQIQAVTGHKTLAEVERYTRKADQVRLARQAMEKQISNIDWQTTSESLPLSKKKR